MKPNLQPLKLTFEVQAYLEGSTMVIMCLGRFRNNIYVYNYKNIVTDSNLSPKNM